MRPLRLLLTLLASAWLPACATIPAPQPKVERTVAAEPFVIAANPLAAQAGLNVLKRGGSAVDAAIAVQAMLSLVEPQSSGVGGGAFMTYYDGRSGKVSVLDGREVAPAQAVSTMFLRSDGTPLSFDEAVLSGRATGVPGAVRMLAVAHGERGKLPWSSLFGDAEKAARDGFIVSPRLARLVHADYAENHAPDVVAYFSQGPGGRLVEAGDRLTNAAYADFLNRLASQGPAALYSGSTAARIVERTRAGPLGGSMTMADLATYRPVKREALCRPYRVYVMCVPPPPSSGVGLIELMKMLERTDIAQRGPSDPQSWYLFAEASRLMYADRDRYVGDIASVPVDGLLDPAYVASRVQLIGPTAGPAPSAGVPAGAKVAANDTTYEPTGTSHFIIRDGDGNVVSMTTTVESIFGSGRMVDGFFLNNQMTDFAFKPVDDQGNPAANAVAPGKRPRSSMVPTILLTPDGKFAGAIGSAGGNSIIAYVAKSLVASVDWNMTMADALAAPNLVARGPNFQGEVTKFSPEILEGLRQRGIDLKPGQGEDSGLTGVLIRNGEIDGGADPRREGVVLTLPRP
ncbi:gamma-glutamyltransferase family protein [Sphingomonas sediminicola]|uniref:Gamma-glutamyltransferase family protein n=1 Tax=Sphingomonas sediminicola TaxID=386874 RepID=A0ABX6T827_9SPHN|nr:gamma-glutamyltransferase family protein [Sphingomonas sediminicola]QNP45388.1 gamma-glutamyltransferase family protein [Sphingomonas sediminicola]